MDSEIQQTLTHYMGGHKVQGKSDRYGDIYNPALGKVVKKVPLASGIEVNSIVENSLSAFSGWSATAPARRAQVLFRFRELIIKNMDELAEIVSCEHGKLIDDAKGSINRGLEVVEFACGISELLKGEYSGNVASGVDSWSMRQPLGVCAGITPFNFPAMVPMWMFPIAIACGNTFVLKPSERDPSCSLRLAELLTEADLPDGVLNVVNGDKETVDALLSHNVIQAISFVGSTAVGEHVYQTACTKGKRVQALCGAKNHMVVMPDANLNQVVDAIMGAAYGSAGERCMAISVVVAIGDIVADKIVGSLKSKVKELKIGAYTQEDKEMGPVVTPDAKKRIHDYINSGVKEGAELVVDGRDIKVSGYEDGFFVGATIFDRVDPRMTIYKEEIFGPVLAIVRAGSYEEAVSLINDHEYGNGAAVFTRDGEIARDFAQRIQIGMVGVNVPIPVPLAFHSFGGWKRSLFGDHNIHGPEGVRFYTKMKTVTSRWTSKSHPGAVYNFKRGGAD
ncbi:MAG: methylmalonate-semialdehyde dehydrogenase (CoA acylating) [Acidiferrobacteraceae bacterium]|nr:methylmalonate-semialdehyde dehydrogenase (CoA acylating) [Acidiferrobacteraceae bacterium]